MAILVRHDDLALTTNGSVVSPIASAVVDVFINDGITRASIFSNLGGTALSNPTAADSLGNFFFYAQPGRYTIKVTNPANGQFYTDSDVVLANDPLQGVLATVTTGSADTALTRRQGNQFQVGITAGVPDRSGGLMLNNVICSDVNSDTIMTPLAFKIPSTGVLGFNSNVDPASSGTVDVGLSRLSPGILALGNGTNGNGGGVLRLGNINVSTGSTLLTEALVVGDVTGVGKGVIIGTYLTLGNTLFGNHPFIGFNARLTTSNIGTSTNSFTPIFNDGTSRTMSLLASGAADGSLNWRTATYTTGAEVNETAFTTRLIFDSTNGNFAICRNAVYQFGSDASVDLGLSRVGAGVVGIGGGSSGDSSGVVQAGVFTNNNSLNQADSSGTGHAPGHVEINGSGAGYVASFNNTDSTASTRHGLLVTTATTSSLSAIARFESGGVNKVNIRSDGYVALISGATIGWNIDTGISRVSGSVLGVGNGSPGDITGTIKAGGILLSHGNTILDATQGNTVDIAPLSNAGSWARSIRVVSVNASNGTDGAVFGCLGNSTTPTYAFMGIPTADITGFNSTKIVGVKNDGTFFIGSTDVGLSRLGSSVLSLGNGTIGDFSGELKLTTLRLGANGSQAITGTGNIPIKPVAGSFLDIVPGGSGNGLRVFETTYTTAKVLINDLGIIIHGTAAPTVGASEVAFGSTVAASATTGASGAVPAQVAGYLIFNVAGTTQKIPYYNN